MPANHLVLILADIIACLQSCCHPVALARKRGLRKARDRTLADAQRSALIDAHGQCQNPWVEPAVILAPGGAGRQGRAP